MYKSLLVRVGWINVNVAVIDDPVCICSQTFTWMLTYHAEGGQGVTDLGRSSTNGAIFICSVWHKFDRETWTFGTGNQKNGIWSTNAPVTHIDQMLCKRLNSRRFQIWGFWNSFLIARCTLCTFPPRQNQDIWSCGKFLNRFILKMLDCKIYAGICDFIQIVIQINLVKTSHVVPCSEFHRLVSTVPTNSLPRWNSGVVSNKFVVEN